MKLRNITIGVRDLRSGLHEFASEVNNLEAGQPVRPKGAGVYFVDLAAIHNVLTAKRIEVLRVVHNERPDSVYRLAKLTRRELKNVQQDVKLLARLGLLHLAKSRSARRSLIPRVDYDALNLQLSLI